MTLVLGLDPSTKKIAVVAIETTTGTFKVASGRLPAKGDTKQTPASLGNALIFMRDFLAEVSSMGQDGQRYAYVEPPLVGRGGVQTAIKLGYVGGVIRGCLAEAGFQVHEAKLTSWRSGFLGVRAGGGRTTGVVKGETAMAVKRLSPKLHGLVLHDSDLIDAAGIALYGADQVRKGALLVPSGPDGSAVQDRRPSVVVRPARVRRVVRR